MICGANWRWLISLQTRAWNKQCPVAGDRCYHSPAGLWGTGAHFTANTQAHSEPRSLRNARAHFCVWRKEWFCFHTKPHGTSSGRTDVHGPRRAADRRRAGRQRRRGGEFTGSFLAGDCTLPCGQILSVDPTGLEFPRKGKEKRKKKPQEADRGQRWSATTGIEPQNGDSEHTTRAKDRGESVGYWCRQRRERCERCAFIFFSKSRDNRHWLDLPISLCNPAASQLKLQKMLSICFAGHHSIQ